MIPWIILCSMSTKTKQKVHKIFGLVMCAMLNYIWFLSRVKTCSKNGKIMMGDLEIDVAIVTGLEIQPKPTTFIELKRSNR